MSGDDNIDDEDEAVFDEDFILDQEGASGSKQPEDAAGGQPEEQPGQVSASFSAWEGEGDDDEEPAFDDDEAFVLEDEPAAIPSVTAGQPQALGDDQDEAFVLDEDATPAAAFAGGQSDADVDFVLEEEATPTAAFAADQSGILGSGDEDQYVVEEDRESAPAAAAASLEDMFSGQQEQLETTASHPEEGALFDAGAVSSQNEFDVGDERHFMETGGSGWDGEDTDPETLGVTKPLPPMESPTLGDAQELLDADATTMEIEEDPELELVEFDADLDQPATVPVFQVEDDAESDVDPVLVLEDAEDGGGSDVDPVLVLEGADDAYDSEAEPALAMGHRDDTEPGEGWEPLLDSTSLDDDVPDPYQDRDQDQDQDHEHPQELLARPERQPDYSEHAAQFVDEHGIPGASEHHVVGAVEPLPHRPWRGLLAVAATILVMGLAGVAYVKPQAFLDVFGVKPEKIEVLKINRPGIDVDITVPDVDINIEPEPPVVTPVATPPVVKPPVVKPVVKPVVRPPVVKPPVVKPVVKPPVVMPVPYTPVAPPAPVVPNTGMTAVQLNELDRIPFGRGRDDGYMKGTSKGNLSLSNNPEILRREFDLVMGSKALAQLMNNNIFFGRVKALDSLFVTLRLDRGEVTLPLADIRVLTHLAFDEYQSLRRQGKAGYIYLRNNNRLGGLIVAQRDDSVILQVQSNRVIIPRSAIEHITENEIQKTVQFSEDDSLEDDDWVRRLVEERLSKQPARRIKDPGTVSIDPDSTSTPEGKR